MPMSVGEVVASYRQRKRQIHNGKPWTQEDLAVAVGTDKAHICRIERGQQLPTRKTLLRICRALDIPWEEESSLCANLGYLPDLRLPTQAEIDAVMRIVTPLLESLSYPAGIVDVIGRIWYYNRLACEFYSAALQISPNVLSRLYRGRTVLELCFDEETSCIFRPLLPKEHILQLMARTRKMADAWQHTPEYESILSRLLRKEAFRNLWELSFQSSSLYIERLTHVLLHPQAGPLNLEYWAARLSPDPRFFVTHHLPADTKARTIFHQLRETLTDRTGISPLTKLTA